MKFLILILIMFSVILYSDDELPIMLKVASKNLEIPDDFRNGVSAVLSKHKYTLIDLNIQEEALRQQAEINEEDDCIDDSCLINTGKMLAAKELVLVYVAFKGKGVYSFNIKILDLEKDIIKKTDTMYYKGELNDYEKLFIFAQKFTNKLLNVNKNDIIIESNYITLDIKTKPLGADVFLSGKSIGKSPVKVRIKKGKHKIKINKYGYDIVNKEISFNKNTKKTFKLKKSKYEIKISSVPDKAKVYDIKNKFLGITPLVLKFDILDKKQKIKINKNYYKTKVIEIGENTTVSSTAQVKKINVKLEKADKYIITKNIKPKNAIVIITNIEAKEEFEFENLSNELKLYEGKYLAVIKHKGFFTEEITINLNKNKNINIELSKRSVDFLIPYTFGDIIVSSGLVYSNLGAGLKLLKFMFNDFHVFEINGKFYRDMANDYFYGDIELQYKLSFMKDKLNIGVSIPFRKIFTDKYQGTMGFIPGLLFSYNVFSKNGFFVDLELLPFVSISLDGEVDTKVFMKSGISIGWSLF